MTSGRVLVVDDDRESCEMLDEALTLRGFSVRWTTSAAEALSLAQDPSAFDVVLTDLRMGSANGLELCRSVNQLDGLSLNAASSGMSSSSCSLPIGVMAMAR